MKKLSRNEMKMVFGGDDPFEVPGDGAGCPAACTGTKANNWQGGTCSASTLPGSGTLPPTTTCTCSVSGGSGCN